MRSFVSMTRFSQVLMGRCYSSTNSIKECIGIVGLGQMGSPMAINLLQNNYNVVAYDTNSKQIGPIIKAGAKTTTSPREVAKKCQIILTMLPNTAAVDTVYTGRDGFLSELTSDHLLIDSSTIDPLYTKQLAEIISSHKARMIDAPVSGGVKGATNGTLTFMVGGQLEDYERAKNILLAMGKNVIHCGGNSTGQVAKICNNLALAIQMTSVAEAMNLGTKLGLQPKIMMDIMNTSSSQCWSSSSYHPYPGLMENVPSSNNYQGGFASKLALKDLGIALSCANETNIAIPLTSQLYDMYRSILEDGMGEKDFSYILQHLKKSIH